MFCPNCGNELDSTAKFCGNCGTILSEIPSEKSGIAGIKNRFNRPKMKYVLILLSIFLFVGIPFAVRLINEKEMKNSISPTLFEESDRTIKEYYDSILPKPYDDGGYMIGHNYDSVVLSKGDHANEFVLEGQVTITDLTQDERPEYNVTLSGTVNTNFFRTNYDLSWEFFVENPDDPNVILLKDLFDAYSTNAPAADNTYAGRYLNVSGEISSIGSVSSDNTVTVELEYYAVHGYTFDAFNARFEFDASDSNLYNLSVGDSTVLTGYLLTGGSERFIYFSDASIYDRTNTPSDSPNYSTDNSNIGTFSNSDSITFDTEFYSLTLPEYWADLCVYDQWDISDYSYGITFYEQQSCEDFDGEGGMLFSIGLYCNDEYLDYPDYTYLGQLRVIRLANFAVVVSFPTDVEFSDAGRDNYLKLSEDISSILASFEPAPGVEAEYTPAN